MKIPNVAFCVLLLWALTRVSACVVQVKHPYSNASASSVYLDNPIGSGYGQGALGSDLYWVAATHNAAQWWQWDLSIQRMVTGVVTQGIQYAWVTQYKVSYSSDGTTWSDVDGGKTFSGNTDGNWWKYVRNNFTTPVNTRLIRIEPTKWYKRISMRSGVLVTSRCQCNWDCYLARYADLRTAYKQDLDAAAYHYTHTGKKEGRNCFCDTSCPRPWAWCNQPGSFFEEKDCDGDGISDPTCRNASGNFGVQQSAHNCADTWPQGTCVGDDDTSCPRPAGWCLSGSVFEEKDCDGDGISDPTCRDASGNFGVQQSAHNCADTWPQGACVGDDGPMYTLNYPYCTGTSQVITTFQECQQAVQHVGGPVKSDLTVNKGSWSDWQHGCFYHSSGEKTYFNTGGKTGPSTAGLHGLNTDGENTAGAICKVTNSTSSPTVAEGVLSGTSRVTLGVFIPALIFLQLLN